MQEALQKDTHSWAKWQELGGAQDLGFFWPPLLASHLLQGQSPCASHLWPPQQPYEAVSVVFPCSDEDLGLGEVEGLPLVT